jgi:O-antigen/teichoic acid export membrane protein
MKQIKSKVYNFLRYTQKYTKTDNVYLFKGGFWLSLQKSSSLLNIILAVIFANFLSKETYGTYQYILSFFGIFGLATLSSMETAITQATARGYEGSLFNAIKTKMKWGLIGSLGAIIISAYYFLQDNFMLGIGFFIVSISIPLTHPFTLISPYLHGKKEFKTVSFYGIIYQIISIISLGLLVLLTKNVILLVFVHFFTYSLFNIVSFKNIIRKFPPNDNVDPKTIPFGIRLSLLNFIPKLAKEFDQIFVWHFLGAAEVAIYSFAKKIPAQINDHLDILNHLAFPKISSRSKDELKKSLPRKALRLYALIIPITIVYIFAVPYVFRVLFPAYGESIIYAQLFSFFLLLFPLTILSQRFTAKMEEKNIAISNLSTSIFRITAIVILTPLYGILGLIIARFLTSIFSNILMLLLFFRK